MRFAMCHADQDGDLADDIADSLLRTIEEETGYQLMQSAMRHSSILILLISDKAADDDQVVQNARDYYDSGRLIFPIILDVDAVGRFRKYIDDDTLLGGQHTDLEAQMVALYKRFIRLFEENE